MQEHIEQSLSEQAYRALLHEQYGVTQPIALPHAPWMNRALRTRAEWEQAVAQVQQRGLPPHRDLPKNWDSLAALDYLLQHTRPDATILDAGADVYSMILPWLFLYGYRDLVGVNLIFEHVFERGPIRYEYADITATHFADQTFDAVTCLSVLEHSVDVAAFFAEMARIIKPNGSLVISTDYFEPAIDTKGREAFGVPMQVFSQHDLAHIFALAQQRGFALTKPMDVACVDNVIAWNGLEYTFCVWSMRKV